jgi:tRNA G18 (ribose-2'-O)-methylase SpoU
MSRVPSSSWAVPFVLGAATALTLVWAGNKASERNQYKRRSRKPSSSESDASKGTNAASADASKGTNASSADASKGTNASSADASKGTNASSADASKGTNASSADASKGTNASSADASKGTNASSADAVEELMDKPDLDHRMLRKAEAVIQWRTTRLVLVIERCTNDHNYSAILRTAEALGIQVVYMIDPPKVDDGEDVETEKPQHSTRTPEEIEARHQHHLFARNAQEWLDVKDYATAEDCVAALRKQGYQLWVTDLSQEACSLSMGNPSIPEKVALVMGTGTLLL